MKRPWKNVGKGERRIRFVLGILLLGLSMTAWGFSRWALFVGLVLLGTAFFQFCPIGYGVRMNTRRRRVS